MINVFIHIWCIEVLLVLIVAREDCSLDSSWCIQSSGKVKVARHKDVHRRQLGVVDKGRIHMDGHNGSSCRGLILF